MKNLKKEILNLRRDGKNYNEISEILNCSKGTISYHCRKIENNDILSFLNTKKKLPVLDFGDNIDDNKIKEVIFHRNNGLNYDQITEKVDISIDKIRKICRCVGINDQTKYQKPSLDDINEMKKFYDEVGSLRKVSKKFGWANRTIRKYIEIPEKIVLTEDEYKIKRKKDVVKNVVNWRKDKKRKLIEYKGGKCEVCGYDKCVSALSFHHKDPKEKDFSISAKSYSYERLKKEVDKCIMVCSNCHIEIHENMNKN